MKISVHAVRELEYALKAAADEAMMDGKHELDASVVIQSAAWRAIEAAIADSKQNSQDAKA